MAIVDLTKKPAARTVPPPATATSLQLPLPQGRLIRPNMLTADELTMLEAAGWAAGDPVPDNLADIVAEQRDSLTNPQKMPLPVPASTPPLDYKEQDISDLSPDEQLRVKQVLADVLAGAKQLAKGEQELSKLSGVDPSVLSAAAMAGQPDVEDDLGSPNYAAGQPKRLPAENIDNNGDDHDRCARCGWPHTKKDVIEITEIDKDLFLEAILGGKQFYRSRELYGGKIKLVIRTLSPSEHDLCWKQITADWNNGTIKNLVDQGEMMTRYRAVLQLVSLDGMRIPVYLPGSADEWRELVEAGGDPDDGSGSTFLPRALKSMEQLFVSESMARLVVGSVADFNMFITKIEANAINPDF